MNLQLKQRTVAFDVKSVSLKGEFEGYLSVFGNLDSYSDVVMPGAFTETLQQWHAKDALPPVLWQHRSTQPIGPFTYMAEDAKGLAVRGQLLIDDVQQAREAYALMKAKVIRGMSIGYEVIDCQYDAQHNIMQLTVLNLWEGSIVTFPANVEALVTDVKQLFGRESLPTLRQFEGLLRDAGCTRKQASDIARDGLVKFLTRDAEGNGSDDDGSSLESVVALIEHYQPQFA